MNFGLKSLNKLFSFFSKEPTLLSSKEQFISAQTLIRAFYAIIFFLAVDNIPSWSNYLLKTNIDPLWPVYWLQYVNTHVGINFILWFYLISSLIAVIFPQLRAVRIILFISLLEFLALKNSFGKIGHGSHVSLLLSFILIFLPPGWHLGRSINKYVQTATLMVFSSCQALILLTYTMSGIWKVLYIIVQFIRGEVHALAPQALALQIANRLLETETTSYFGPWFIDNYYVGWPLMIGAIYLELFAFWAVFRPSLHQLWALSLILFHLSIYFTMTITFEQNCLWLAIFFLNSPFRLKEFNWRQVVRDLPLIGSSFSYIK